MPNPGASGLRHVLGALPWLDCGKAQRRQYTPAQVPTSRGVQSVLGCEKLTQARKRVSDLEFARKAFERNAAKGAPILGASVVSESVATQD